MIAWCSAVLLPTPWRRDPGLGADEEDEHTQHHRAQERLLRPQQDRLSETAPPEPRGFLEGRGPIATQSLQLTRPCYIGVGGYGEGGIVTTGAAVPVGEGLGLFDAVACRYGGNGGLLLRARAKGCATTYARLSFFSYKILCWREAKGYVT